jgi:hypothetical protein
MLNNDYRFIFYFPTCNAFKILWFLSIYAQNDCKMRETIWQLNWNWDYRVWPGWTDEKSLLWFGWFNETFSVFRTYFSSNDIYPSLTSKIILSFNQTSFVLPDLPDRKLIGWRNDIDETYISDNLSHHQVQVVSRSKIV